VSPEGRRVRCGGRAMNEISEHHSVGNGDPACSAAAPSEPSLHHASANFDHKALAQVISSRWRENRPLFTLNRQGREARLGASWWQQPADSALYGKR
jgi:hypothetical protein